MAWNRGEQRNPDSPEVGKYALKLVKKGVEVAASIDFYDGLWIATINGKPEGEANADPQLADGVQKVWLWARRINEADYAFFLARYQHAALHAPDSPFANPTRPISLHSMRAIGGIDVRDKV